ncbi:hypothetical protein HMPREF1548_01309 [Clostridium sp. KLE 1755]|nr:hypothetical protein HMPREF1548_01309 [Clostridium sp. KLE 1755]
MPRTHNPAGRPVANPARQRLTAAVAATGYGVFFQPSFKRIS